MAVPSEKAKRYDRQLRLWGDHGQAALENARICIVNASATCTEILKNLVLPGIGAFLVVDNKIVTQADLGSNFFLTADSVGKVRGKVARDLLQELNNQVRGEHIEDDVEAILKTNIEFFCSFDMVIVSEMSGNKLLHLAEVCWKSFTPFMVACSYGLIGYLRLSLPSHEIVESHPDSAHHDLRLDCPFPPLVSYMDSIQLNSLDNAHHANVPYLVVLYKYLQLWRQNHNGEFPRNYREKKEFKAMLSTGIRKNEDGVPIDEDNFDEAIQNVNSLLVPTQIPSMVRKILDDPACMCITPESSNFWILTRAVREFVNAEGNGNLPLRGSIPDMTSSSKAYIELQRVYQAKANQDREAVSNHVSHLLAGIGRPTNSISEGEIKRFCSNSSFLRVSRFRSLKEEYQPSDHDIVRAHLENPDSDIVYYILLRAAQKFHSQYKYFPGEEEASFEMNVAQMKVIVSSLLQQMGVPCSTVSDDHVTEFCRYGGGEVHSVAAFIGGVGAQEVIKVITRQFVPLNNTLIYNAASSTTTTVAM